MSQLLVGSGHVQQNVASESSSGNNAYDFGFNNPQFSDRGLLISEERDATTADTEDAVKQQVTAPRLLRKLHVNSLTLAANSEVFRYCFEPMFDLPLHAQLLPQSLSARFDID